MEQTKSITITPSHRTIRQRKFFMALPVLVVPFLTLIFWALGGGTVGKAASSRPVKNGFDLQLPAAYVKDKPGLNKMSYYALAEKDTASFRKQQKRDAYYESLSYPASGREEDLVQDNAVASAPSGNESPEMSSGLGKPEIPAETRVYQKLRQLNRLIDQPDTPSRFADVSAENPGVPEQPANQSLPFNSAPADRMQQMMPHMQGATDEDTEMVQINRMLEKILDIQHPGRVEEELKQQSEKLNGPVFAVSARREKGDISFWGDAFTNNTDDDAATKGEQTSHFYALKETDHPKTAHAIKAVIYGDQSIVNGATVKLSLSTDIYINDLRIPRDYFIYGLASLRRDRLQITITSIRYKDFLFPVNLSVYDLDGIKGIHIPGGLTRQAAKQSASQAMQTIRLQTLDPSIGAEAASAGISTVRNLLGKHIRVVRVTVKSGYRVLLKDQRQATSIRPTLYQ
ncbi:MAG TPA: conjugative transposon protein TraM [Chitinophagaceae bacterium]|nr:conjugative transposon protein TraM [Chitinophagaceae bacterium]